MFMTIMNQHDFISKVDQFAITIIHSMQETEQSPRLLIIQALAQT
jgi:hypothetical protein